MSHFRNSLQIGNLQLWVGQDSCSAFRGVRLLQTVSFITAGGSAAFGISAARGVIRTVEFGFEETRFFDLIRYRRSDIFQILWLSIPRQ